MWARVLGYCDGAERDSAVRVAVTRQLPGDALGRLPGVAEVRCWSGHGPPTPAELRGLVAGADGLISMFTDQIDVALLDAAPTLRVVSNVAVGVDNVDVAALTARGIPLGHTPGVLTDATADLAFALILAVARRVVESHEAVHAGEWTTWTPNGFIGLELAGSTLGVVGTGAIGQAVIRRAQGFGMTILASSRTERSIDGVTYLPLSDLLEASDVISLHVALAAETRHLIGPAELERMKQGAILINTTRGPVVDQVALYAALASGHLGGAGLDVFDREPVPIDEPLLTLANCVTVPHIGSATTKTREAMAHLAVDNMIAGLSGERLVRCANPEVYEGR
jgi:glyoxylate reductase